MIGRDRVLPEIATLVRTHQLVTLTGVGGVGKTRLALAVAAELADGFPDGVWLVELAPVGDPDAVPDAIANALGVTPQGDTAVIDVVAEAVAGRRLLIVIDNCEHVLAAAVAAIEQVLARSDAPRILATSREGLLGSGEAVVPVAPLALDGGVTSDAVRLFVERAGTARPGFGIFDEQTAAAVVEICQTLDGLPLGIELAAARMAAMSAGEVRERLGERFRLLTGPEHGPDRQSTLRSTVAWSVDLLDDAERGVLQTASVFAGGFDLPALCAVAEASDDVEILRLLDSLVRKSLVVAHHGAARTRYSMFETIRAFAHETLSEERAALRDRHAAHFATEAALRWERWNGPGWPDEVAWVQAELANLRAAFRWSVERGQVEVATDVAAHAALMGFSVELFETIGWAEALLEEAAACRRPATAPAVRRRGVCLLRRAGRGRDARTPTAPPSWSHEVATSPANPDTPRSSRLLDRCTAAIWTATSSSPVRWRALPGPGQAYGIAAYVDGLQSAGRVERGSRAHRSGGRGGAQTSPTPTGWPTRRGSSGLAWSKADAQRALETWDEAMAYIGEHEVRFFEGFMARDAALLHTSDGQLEAALTLFGSSIEAFLRAGAVAS